MTIIVDGNHMVN